MGNGSSQNKKIDVNVVALEEVLHVVPGQPVVKNPLPTQNRPPSMPPELVVREAPVKIPTLHEWEVEQLEFQRNYNGKGNGVTKVPEKFSDIGERVPAPNDYQTPRYGHPNLESSPLVEALSWLIPRRAKN